MTTDVLFDVDTLDLRVVNGDLIVGESTQQHQHEVVVGDKGHFHFAPVLGVGVTRYLLDRTSVPGLVASIRRELERDGQTVESVVMRPGGRIEIVASYPDYDQL